MGWMQHCFEWQLHTGLRTKGCDESQRGGNDDAASVERGESGEGDVNFLT